MADRRMTRLFIENISSRADNNELEDLFSSLGRVSNFEIKEGSGYVEYETSRDASEAIRRYIFSL